MIFTIADLHLPLGIDKPMDVFGQSWDNYVERLRDGWQASVGVDDTVVLPGDFSWATYLDESKKDFVFLESLNGNIFILKGNHDYWWTTMSKLNEFLDNNGYKTISFLHNNSYEAEGISICGTRGWLYPGFSGYKESSEKYFMREVIRLENSLKTAKTDEIYVFTHYPPMSNMCEGNDFIDMMKKYNVKKCFYGHLHGKSHENKIREEYDGIKYYLISSDYLKFSPKRIK